jgi:UDP-N-acetylglucosamine--N-acetylmuramyl-(pentapeptide) pyrophosphoryl-undecaprenol N-acetylglucosamine transferase
MSDIKDTRKKKICIACGGSAGHIFPGLTLGRELVRRYGGDVEISFLTSDNKLGQTLLQESGFSFHALPLKSLQTGSVQQKIVFIVSLFKGSLKSMKIILSDRPDCFIGFGSYIAGPPFIAASFLGVPTLIHEQNTVMGRGNRIMKHFATRIALSFPEGYESRKKNTVVTGNPIRESVAIIQDRRAAIKFLGMDYNKFTVLVIGGSQGSKTIDSATIDMFRNMERESRSRIQVIHLSGDKDYERLKRAYQNIEVSYKLYPFFEDMGILYSASDISISRAGASVIFELCAHKIPSILIPYPYAGSHQVQNASFLETEGVAIMIEEKELTEASLNSAVLRLVGNKELRESLSERMGSIANLDAGKRLADEVGLLAGLEK